MVTGRSGVAPVTSWLVTSLLVTSSVAVRVEIASPQQPVRVNKGTSVQLVCDVTDVSEIEIASGQLTWGRIIATIETMKSDGINYVIENVTTNQRVRSSLTILSVQYTDDASYFCLWRQASQTTDYIVVIVKGQPEIMAVELDGQPIAGQNVVITCTVQGMPLPTIEWSKPSITPDNSASVDSLSARVFRNNSYTRVSRLTLVNVTSLDIGYYQCSAENDHGTDDRDYRLDLYSWATISTVPGGGRNVTSEPIVMSLSRVSLYCAGYNIPNDVDLQIDWTFRAEGNNLFVKLKNNNRTKIDRLADAPLTSNYDYFYVTSRLTMDPDFSDQGTLRCRVYEAGMIVTTADRYLRVQDAPRVTLVPARVGMAIGDVADVTCRVEARPFVTSYSWLQDYAINLHFSTRQVNNYTLELKHRLGIYSQIDYKSVFSCRAGNALGTQQRDLTVEEKDDCDGTVCTGPHEYCMDAGYSYNCVCESGYYWEASNERCIAYTTPIPTPSPTTPLPTRPPVSTPGTTVKSSTTVEPGSGDSERSDQVGLYAGIGAGVVVIIIIVIVVIVLMRRRDQCGGRSRSEPKTSETAPMVHIPLSQNPMASSTYYSNSTLSPFTDPYDYTPLKMDRSEFPRERLQLHEKLGQGTFGTVVRALALSLFNNGKWDTVAVKMHNEAATDAEKSEFLRELSLLRSLPRHQNVVPYVGCCTLAEPTYIIMEYCPSGDLLNYLRKRRPDRGVFVGQATNDLTARDLFSFALHVARGMAHVAGHKIVHRDVAARNVLMSELNVCKMSDFGLARRVDDNSDVYEIASRRPLPLRWMSPESLRDGVHTSQSDVWSYGILLWELVTLGSSPYPGSTGKAVIDQVTSGTRPEIPPQCRGELAHLMSSCWAMTPEMRPTFDVISVRFEKLLEQEGDYLQLENIKEGIYSILEPSISGERV